jgi:hypothetical protein
MDLASSDGGPHPVKYTMAIIPDINKLSFFFRRRAWVWQKMRQLEQHRLFCEGLSIKEFIIPPLQMNQILEMS